MDKEITRSCLMKVTDHKGVTREEEIDLDNFPTKVEHSYTDNKFIITFTRYSLRIPDGTGS